MESRGKSINIDINRLEKISRKVTGLLKKECKDAIEAMYVLKVTLYMFRCALIEDGVVLDNEAQLDAELTDMIDRAIKEDE